MSTKRRTAGIAHSSPMRSARRDWYPSTSAVSRTTSNSKCERVTKRHASAVTRGVRVPSSRVPKAGNCR